MAYACQKYVKSGPPVILRLQNVRDTLYSPPDAVAACLCPLELRSFRQAVDTLLTAVIQAGAAATTSASAEVDRREADTYVLKVLQEMEEFLETVVASDSSPEAAIDAVTARALLPQVNEVLYSAFPGYSLQTIFDPFDEHAFVCAVTSFGQRLMDSSASMTRWWKTNQQAVLEQLPTGLSKASERADEGGLLLEAVRRLLYDSRTEKQTVFSFAESLLAKACSNVLIRGAVEAFLCCDDFARLCGTFPKEAARILASFVTHETPSRCSPYDLLALAANLVHDALGGVDKYALEEFIQRVDFLAMGSVAFPHALLASFCWAEEAGGELLSSHQIIHQKRANKPKQSQMIVGRSKALAVFRLLHCLAGAEKLGVFQSDDDSGILGCEEVLIGAFDTLFSGGGGFYNQVLGNLEGRRRAIVAPLVVLHAEFARGSTVQKEFLQILVALANSSSTREQHEASKFSRFSYNGPPSTAEQLHASLCELSLFFNDCRPAAKRGHVAGSMIHAGISSHGAELFDRVCGLLVKIAEFTSAGWGLSVRLGRLAGASYHVINVDKKQLSFLLAKKEPLDRFPMGLDAVYDALDSYCTERRGLPSNWKTQDIAGMIFYYYCFARYPLDDFHRWVKRGLSETDTGDDVSSPSEAEVNHIFQHFNNLRSGMAGRDEIADIGFKCLQYSQIFAVQIALQQVDKGLNAFLRVGTGQGKSVIIAMLAAHYAKRGCKVYVFTCYSHLAVRDAERFNNFFEKLGIKAAAIKQGSQVCDASVSVMYSDLHTFLCARQSEVLRRCKPDCSTEWSMEAYRGLFEVGERSSVVLLDEFDALILQHASVGNTVYDIKDVVTVGSMKQSDLESTQAFKDAILHRNPDMSSEFMEALSDVGLDETILAFLSAPGGWNAGHSGYDALGKHHQYIGGNLHELCNRGNFYSRLLATKCLSLLQSYNYVIGISGSITAKEVKCFSKLFDRRPCYVEIPPYYGPDSSKNNQLKDLRSLQTGKWLQEIAGDAKMAVQTGRPVLVFLHPENPHWHQLLSALQAVAGSKGVQEIKSENDIRDELLGKACEEGMVTLSSHVAGRGADFVVQNDIKRKGGLHVIIAYEPTDGKSRRGYNELDQRMVDQMKGRTARMGAPGSYSIITTTALPTNTVETIEGKQELNHKHILTTHIFSRLASDGSATAAHWKRYAFFTCFLDQSTRMPAGLEHHLALQGGGDGISGVQNAAEHVLRNIIGFPSFPLPISPAPRRSNIFVSNRVQPVDVTPSSHDVRNAGRQHVRAQQGRGVGSSDRPSTTDGGGWRWAAIFSTGGFAAVAAGCSIQ